MKEVAEIASKINHEDIEKVTSILIETKKEGGNIMVERILRGMAGVFTIRSIVLAYLHNPDWLFFTAG